MDLTASSCHATNTNQKGYTTNRYKQLISAVPQFLQIRRNVAGIISWTCMHTTLAGERERDCVCNYYHVSHCGLYMVTTHPILPVTAPLPLPVTRASPFLNVLVLPSSLPSDPEVLQQRLKLQPSAMTGSAAGGGELIVGRWCGSALAGSRSGHT